MKKKINKRKIYFCKLNIQIKNNPINLTKIIIKLLSQKILIRILFVKKKKKKKKKINIVNLFIHSFFFIKRYIKFRI
jgi:hypothetical protein